MLEIIQKSGDKGVGIQVVGPLNYEIYSCEKPCF